MEQYFAYQKEVLENLKKAEKNYRKTPKERIKKPYLETRLDNLEQLWTVFKDGHKSIIGKVTQKDKLDEYFTKDMYEEFEELYVSYKTMLKEALQPYLVSSSASSSEVPKASANRHVVSECEVKLPRIQLPTFNGKYVEWQTFYDMFNSLIHTNNKLSSVQKLHYLKSNLSGEPECLLRNFSTTDANYDEAWKQLVKRYNNKRYNCNAILRSLFSQKQITDESASAIKHLLDTTTTCLQSLRNMQINIDHWDVFIIYLVVSKLDPESIKQWEYQLGTINDELPSWAQLSDFLESRFRSLEMIDTNKVRTQLKLKNPKPKSFYGSVDSNKNKSNVTSNKCVMCNGEHLIYHCKEFSRLNVKDRQNYVQKNNLCFNCLSPSRAVMKCRNSVSCRRCGRRHHSLLHFDRELSNTTHEDAAVKESQLELINNEIAAILISFDKHSEWQSKEVKIRPKSGSMLLYSRKKVRYRRDGYCWKKRKDGKTTREDHMKLKVQGTECIYGCYVHSAILPTFHRRCYWLLQNPDIVLVHYLNVPYPDDNKLATVAPSLALWADKKEWTKDELVSQLKPMFFSEDDPDINSDLEISGKMFQTAETVEAIVGQLMEKQRAARAAALARQLECGCPDSTCNDSRNCVHPLRRIQAAKPPPSDHQVSSTTGPSPRPMSHPPRQYTRDHRPAQQSASPLLLSLGQIQGGGGLLILNGTSNGTQQNSSLVSPLSVTSFVCEEPRDRYRQQYKPTFVLKREIPDSQPSSCIRTTETTFKIETQDEKIDIDFDRKIKVEPRSRNQVIASAPATPSRYPDLVERLESKVLTDNCDDTLVLLGTDGNLGSSGFFDETLELSHEDIQKTLSANMPTCELDRNGVRHTDTANVMVSGIDTMDFIDSCEVVASPTTGVDDNVFVNLDAFDMLGDFPELEVLDPSSMSTNPVTLCDKSPPAQDTSEKMQTESSGEGALSITDYSPEWAYPEGGAKVLVAGPWTDTSDQYTVLFDNFPVPSILVQNGLLRCYCPAHEAGLAALQVARGGRVVSDTVVFEYKAGPVPAPSSPASAPLPSLDIRRFSLLQRLQRLQDRLQMKIEPADDKSQIEDVQLYSSPKFEERLVEFCQTLSARSTGNTEGFTSEPNEDGSTILHLAAALGYTKLTTVLLRWRQDDTSLALEKEVNLGARDSDNCTPLMVASAAGHVETAVVLARWSAGTRREAGARAAAAAARRAGHARLAALLDRIHPPHRDGVFLRPHCLSQKSRAGSLESNLVKRPSIDSGINMADAFRSSSAIDKSDSNSSARWERSMSLPLDSDNSEDSLGDSKIGRRMDLALCETAPRRAESPLVAVQAPAAAPAGPARPPGEQDDRVFTLAEQIIAAMPDRIKNESSSLLSGCGLDNGGGEDTLMVPLLDEATTFTSDFSFEFSDNTYRYCGASTPSSGSVSPGSAALSPPPAPPATLTEFLHATTHFSNLTLNDREQRELYSAAITIQKAYRQYRGRQLQRRAAAAAITIQNCYRRYKQFAYLKQMHAAATVIQRGYRAMRARRMATTPIKRTYSQRRQNQAARKIQQFMRQSKINTWEEFTTNVAERTSRKREGGPAIAGCPPKLIAAHHQYTTHAQ